ncbi:MAG TPA: SH3 domain-containing protein [Gemmatimonadales bacterium]|nr:SH3 domain-containing protein [Gemmatimonadales bacterium]
MRIPLLVPAAALALVAPRLAAQASAPIRDTTAYTAAATTLRAQPDSQARVVTTLPVGWPVRVAACIAGWCDVRAGSLSGYLRADSLTLTVPRGAPGTAAAPLAPDVSIGVDLTSRLTLGVAAGRSFRLVPEVSYVSERSRSYGSSTQIATYTIDASDAEVWLGMGFYFVQPLPVRPLGAPCLLYFGPRLGAAFVSAEQKVDNLTLPSDAATSRTDLWVGAAAGAELMVSRSFSVGAEAQATKVFPGSPRVTGVTTSSLGVVQAWVDFESRGTLVLRFYP